MKLKFVDQPYQTDAVNSICDIFDGCEVKDSLFTIDVSSSNTGFLTGEGYDYFIGHSNRLGIDEIKMLENVRKIQEHNDIMMTDSLHNKNFTVEMETGTGKTYAYTKTILEMNKRYGFTKFIIVVPSIAIKEGVNSSFNATNEHFKEKYDNVIYRWFVYDSNHLERIRDFATSTNVEIMIINIDAFRKSFDDPTKENKANLIHRESDKLQGNKPIDLIAGCNPIVIIDEPQSVDGTKKAKEAISSLNPLCIFRYSATHKEMFNLMYRLTPVDAYHENLVKHIEVASVTSNDASAKPYIKLLGVSNDKGKFKARLEIYYKNSTTGTIDKKTVNVKPKDDIYELSNRVDYYDGNGFIISNIDSLENFEQIEFSNGEVLHKGESMGEVDDSIMKRQQIRLAIEYHLKKELDYIRHGIKVLSLFFIDEVKNYRDYDAPEEKGKYAVWFEEEYNNLINSKRFKTLKDYYSDKISLDAKEVHEGYFATDGKGRVKNSTDGKTNADDETTYQLIMKDKERLLSFEEPVRFIFSHSALKEGWDNPNIFQICTLVETKDTMTKRQKVGRGLRICVNQDGERVLETKYNTLSVIANESYKEFASTLQKELETDNFKFGIIEEVTFTGQSLMQTNGELYVLTQDDSKYIYEFLIKNDYMNRQGRMLPKFYEDVNNDSFKLPGKYESFTNKVAKRIEKQARTIEIKDASAKHEIKLNKEVKLSPEFEILWNKIKQKTVYSVNMDVDLLKKQAIEQIKNMPRVREDKVDVTTVKVDLTKKGVETSIMTVNEAGFTYTADENRNYPDVIRRLQDSTKLLRKTIIDILAKSERLNEFYINPEEFIKRVSKILLDVKKANLTEGVKYEKIDECYEQDFIFNDESLYGDDNDSILADKSVYDYVKYDSDIERAFAEQAEADENVILYTKLPDSFKIDTPIGTYNPDWALVMNNDNEEKLYFVAETKGTEDINQLRGSEKGKIKCGKLHFEVIDTGIKYEVIKELKTLKGTV